MTESSLLDRDLAALRDDCRHAPLPVDDTLRRTNMYRDDRLGAEARRDALRDQRRNELALMPLSLSHVFAARVGRAAAGAATLACVAVFAVGISDPVFYHLISVFLPGLNLTTCAALGTGIVLGAYVIATWIAQRVFERRMRLAIETAGADVHADIDRLAEGPLEIGRRLVRKADGWAIGSGIAGATVVTSMCGFFLFIVASTTYRYGWTSTAAFAAASIERNITFLGAGFVLAIVGAVFVGVACGRDGRNPLRPVPVWMRFFSHWSSLVVGGVLVAATLYDPRAGHWRGKVFETGPRVLEPVAVVAGVTALFLVMSWVLLAWRRREEARIA